MHGEDNIKFRSQCLIFLLSAREIWEFEFMSENNHLLVFGWTCCLHLHGDWTTFRWILKTLLGEYGWIVYYLGCLISESQ
jgi:hypothetical protein